MKVVIKFECKFNSIFSESICLGGLCIICIYMICVGINLPSCVDFSVAVLFLGFDKVKSDT